MSIVVKTHPLAEILAKKLFGIEGVPKSEQTKMVRRSIKAAVEFYDNSLQLKDSAVKDSHPVSRSNANICDDVSCPDRIERCR